MNDKLYLLYHGYEINGFEEIKILGIYTTPKLAEQAKKRYIMKDGFRDFPQHCFIIQAYTPNEDEYWTEGFFSEPESVFTDFQKLSALLSEFLNIPDDWENEEYFALLQEVSWKTAVSDNAAEIAEYIERLTDCFQQKSKAEYLAFAEKILHL